MAILCLLPFYLIITSSFTAESYIIKNGYSLYIPEFSVEGYKLVIGNPAIIGRSYLNTIFVTLVGTGISLFITSMTGYVLQRQDFIWRNKISFFFFSQLSLMVVWFPGTYCVSAILALRTVIMR